MENKKRTKLTEQKFMDEKTLNDLREKYDYGVRVKLKYMDGEIVYKQIIIARKDLWAEGVDYRCGTGHGVGFNLSVHEGPPNIKYLHSEAKTEEVEFKPGMICSDEPGVYFEKQFGIRCENMILCKKEFENEYGEFLGFETLTLVPFDLSPFEKMTGAAATLQMFPDVPNSYWASCPIDKLATNDVVVGYPDGLYRPNRNISRAEFATMLVKGFNLDTYNMERGNMFTDVSRSNWANASIAKAVEKNLLKGYPNGQFRPNNHVTRAEALTSIGKGMTCDIDKCKADEILSHYADGASVPSWARIPVAKSLENGALKDSPNPKMIMPNKDASRADVASMLQTVRVALGYDTNPKTANNICPACPIDKKVFAEEEQIVKIPTLQISMIDQITAKSSHVGQYFRANTLEDVTINGVTYPCGSTVTGQVVEVVRPSGCNKGAIKLSFTEIKNGDCKTKLPKQILSAQINKSKNVNPVARLVEMPFTLAGSLIGVVGRTAGGILTNVGNAAENITNDAGYMLGHGFQGQFGAAARNLGDGLWETVKAPVDVTRTALSGTMGLFQTTGDEFAYLVDPRGYKISAVNPREHVTIAFGCNE